MRVKSRQKPESERSCDDDAFPSGTLFLFLSRTRKMMQTILYVSLRLGGK